MVVKSKRGRRRYIAVRSRSGGKVTDESLVSFLNSTLYRSGIRFKVIQFDGCEGIVRVGGTDQHRAIENINGAGDNLLVTLRTSGTLHALREGPRVDPRE